MTFTPLANSFRRGCLELMQVPPANSDPVIDTSDPYGGLDEADKNELVMFDRMARLHAIANARTWNAWQRSTNGPAKRNDQPSAVGVLGDAGV